MTDTPTYASVPAIADELNLPVTKVHQHLRQKHLIGVRRNGVLVVPKIFFDDKGHVVKSLSGLLVVLHDGGYSENDIQELVSKGLAKVED